MSDSPARVLVSVLIPTRNEADHVEATVAMLQAQSVAGPVEFIFIDGRSDDETRAILARAAERDPRIKILDNPARFIPNALNIGLGAARGDFVARMDAHTRYPEDYLQRGIGRLEMGDVAWVSGPQLPEGAGRWSRRIALALSGPLGIGGAEFRKPTSREIETDSGFTGLWRRVTLLEHSGWDERWQINEDAELAARIRASGGRIVCLPEMAARYIPRESLGALARQYWRYGRYRALTSLEHPE
ncbi:MAG: glycosyltransferase, partial [Chloroflexota bacterium]|nr:glycosyltransferase [Chloroflexota bacterium]